MKNEIKEILYLEKYINKYKSDEKSIINGNRLTTPAMLDYLEVKDLLDYITNLQEENERLKNIIDKSIKYASETRDLLDSYHNGEWNDMIGILYGNEIEDDD